MITTDYELLAAEMKRRGWDLEQIDALAKIMPGIDARKVKHGKLGSKQTELTYFGKSRREIGEIKRKK